MVYKGYTYAGYIIDSDIVEDEIDKRKTQTILSS